MVAYTLKDDNLQLSYHGNYTLIWITFALGFIHLVVPIQSIIEKIRNKKDSKLQNLKTFDQAKSNFLTDYDIENPVTRKKAILRYMKTLKAEGKLESNPALDDLLTEENMETEDNPEDHIEDYVDIKTLKTGQSTQDFRFMDAFAHSETKEVINMLKRYKSPYNFLNS
jgi:hypothetical protein